MYKSIPTTIDGILKFPLLKQETTPTTYRVATVGDLVQGVNIGAILTCKIVMHLDRP